MSGRGRGRGGEKEEAKKTEAKRVVSVNAKEGVRKWNRGERRGGGRERIRGGGKETRSKEGSKCEGKGRREEVEEERR